MRASFTQAVMRSLNGLVGKDAGTNVAVIQEAIRHHPKGPYVL